LSRSCKLYVSLVRPHLDYTCHWNPNLLKHIRSSEAVYNDEPQGWSHNSVKWNMLRGLHFWIYLHLSITDVSAWICDNHKIIHGLVCIPCRELLTFSNNITRSNGLIKIIQKKVNTSYSFVNRVINNWNSLLSRIVNALDTLTFKTLLDINCMETLEIFSIVISYDLANCVVRYYS